uniref:Uncharacterized protein n=1 Tax=Rhizophora mucronata TaxID=61149 RepID=A0A2P2NT85_RHIMU
MISIKVPLIGFLLSLNCIIMELYMQK